MFVVGVSISYGLFLIFLDILNEIKLGMKGDVFELRFMLYIVVFVILD